MNFFNKFKLLLIDFCLSILSVFFALALSQDLGFIGYNVTTFIAFFVFPVMLTTISYFFSIYNILWQYAGTSSYARIFLSSFISVGGLYVVHSAVVPKRAPFSAAVCMLVASFTFICMLLFRYYLHKRYQLKKKSDDSINGNIMIIGGGSAGNLIINDIKKNNTNKTCVIKCILDDDPKKRGQIIRGITVFGGTDMIVKVAEEEKIDIIVFAIPTCPPSKKSAILNLCQKTGCKVRVIPSFYSMIGSDKYDVNIGVNSLREVQIEDLLGRDPIDINVDSVLNYVAGETVLVTGGGGSIGSELCRQISAHNPKSLIIFDIYENNAYEIQNELLRKYPELDLKVLIGSVRDESRLESVFSKFKPTLVFHAAAHKHVPLMEDSPNESIKNNVFGTYNTAKFADKYGVKKFVLISTDKAVNPTNIMGASKRICEMIIQYFNPKSETEFVAVRFGNVLGSNGSVIPLFKQQISEGGPVTVTDPNIIRYFMTIPEAVSLVLQAGATAKGGEIFVLDMGEPVKIIDLAENLIRLSGYTPYKDIQITFTGLRPGEKMYEEKLLGEEGLKLTKNRLIHIGRPIVFDEDVFVKTLEELKNNMSDDDYDIRASVQRIVPTFSYDKL